MSKSRSYVFTLNNYSQIEEQQVQNVDCVFLLYGKEVGASGTPHLQGFIKFKSQRSFNAVSKLLPRAHVEVCRDVGRAIEYCKKDGDVWQKGVEPEKNGGDKLSEKIEKNKRLRDLPLNELVESGEISILDVRKLKNAKLDLAEEKVTPVTLEALDNHWFCGPSGTGKSWTARDTWPDAYIKNKNKWWCGYNGEDTVIIEEWCPEDNILLQHLKVWADKYPFRAEVKGGSRMIRPKRLVITSNYSIEECVERQNDLAPLLRRFQERRFIIKYTN